MMLQGFLFTGLFLFSLGMYLFFTRRNAVMALMGIELMLNAANINFVAFARYDKVDIEGQMAGLFIIVLAAAETAVALAIILQAYKHFQTLNLDKMREE